MPPFFFGPSERRLYGVYDAPPPGESRPRGVVLCYPWGQEYLRAHRSFCHLADLLTERGIHTLRFDYYGSGDSAGDDLDVDLQSMIEDAGHAVDELRDTAGITRIALVGLRLGACVAAKAAAQRTDVERVALWDPIIDGSEYAAELGRLGRRLTPAPGTALNGDRPLEVLGFRLAESLRADLADLRPVSYPTLTVPTLVLSTTVDRDPYTPLVRWLASGEGPVDTARRAGPIAWAEEGDFGTAGMPVNALQHLVAWLS